MLIQDNINKLIFFTCQAFSGINYIIEEFSNLTVNNGNKHFKITTIKNEDINKQHIDYSENKKDPFLKKIINALSAYTENNYKLIFNETSMLEDEDKEKGERQNETNNNFQSINVILVPNLPIELYYEYLVGKFCACNKKYNNSCKICLIKTQIVELNKALENFLNHNSLTFVLFYWEDGSPEQFVLNKIFNKTLFDKKNVFMPKVTVTNKQIGTLLKLRGVEEIKAKELAELFNGNLEQIRLFLENEQFIRENNLFMLNIFDPFQERFNFFETLGKFLYNKRLNEYGEKFQPSKKDYLSMKYKHYFNTCEIIYSMKHDYRTLRAFLNQNYINHFNSILEVAIAANRFSETEILDNFKYLEKDQLNNLNITHTILCAYNVMASNKSQYEYVQGKKNTRASFIRPLENSFNLNLRKKQNLESFKNIRTFYDPRLCSKSFNTYNLELKPFYRNKKYYQDYLIANEFPEVKYDFVNYKRNLNISDKIINTTQTEEDIDLDLQENFLIEKDKKKFKNYGNKFRINAIIEDVIDNYLNEEITLEDGFDALDKLEYEDDFTDIDD